MDHTKNAQAYLNSPCQDLFLRGLGFVTALLFFWGGESIFRVRGVHWGVRSGYINGQSQFLLDMKNNQEFISIMYDLLPYII